MDGTQIEINSSISLNNPPSQPSMKINSLGPIDMQSTGHMNIMGLTDTYVNAGNQVQIQTTVLPQPPATPAKINMSGISKTKTTNTLLSFERLGIGTYPPRVEQGKSPVTPLLLYDKEINTIITRWVSIEPSPSRRKKKD
tara:strand:- start:1660 stop:2079 length:420 start_codon:yes stop_codon:yes gene_type:complete